MQTSPGPKPSSQTLVPSITEGTGSCLGVTSAGMTLTSEKVAVGTKHPGL